jgi:hypothetical protein
MSLSKSEQEILKNIMVPSENDPDKPEFPPNNPRFPATPTFKIDVSGFDNVWIKDESINPTGTHKDRMAWEMVVSYRQLLMAKDAGRIDVLPQMSIISSGSAANAIQHMLRKYGLPNLKVLMDYRADIKIKKALEKLGCELYETDLTRSILYTNDILKLTDNVNGIDITSDESLGPHSVFYDWLSYEVINENPDYVFVPYGTGNLYENVINVAVRESKSFFIHDKRLKINSSEIKRMNFLGATTNNPNTKADKLYSPHLPFVHFDTHWIKLAIQKGYIGADSSVHTVQEKYFEEAMKIAKDNKVNCEPSGIAGMALLLQMRKLFDKDKKILIVNTGRTRYDAPIK